MKKIPISFFVFILVCFLAGCSGNRSSVDSDTIEKAKNNFAGSWDSDDHGIVVITYVNDNRFHVLYGGNIGNGEKDLDCYHVVTTDHNILKIENSTDDEDNIYATGGEIEFRHNVFKKKD